MSNDAGEHWVYKNIKKFGGTDASEAIKGTDKAARALVQLFLDKKEHIVARVVKKETKLKDIPQGELENHINPHELRGAWTVFAEVVYDITREFPSELSIYFYVLDRP
jgi:hypothetical protein